MIVHNKHPSQCLYEFDNYIRKQDHFNANVTIEIQISNDVRGVGKHAFVVQTKLEQVAKSQRELLMK